jgi:hypothetical protein
MSPVGKTLRVRIVDFDTVIHVDWAPALDGVHRSFKGYAAGVGSPDLEIRVRGTWARRERHLSEQQFDTIYGRFLRARWDVSDHPASVTISPMRSPLRLIRPLVDLEGHPIHPDVGRIIHERVVPSFVQLFRADRLCFVHGAAMADARGRGLLISGVGGVGKTSLALELGRNHGWSFISDDMVPIDRAGMMHLNANRPKLYAYNVLGDPDLEAQLLARDGWLGRIQWHMRKRWPSYVRREIDPEELYPGITATAPLTWMIIVERANVDRIVWEPISATDAAGLSVEILESELVKVSPDIDRFNSKGITPNTWDPKVWNTTLKDGFGKAELFSVRVPLGMKAVPYRREMVSVIAEITKELSV